MTTPLEHVAVHVRDALATDSRVGELGLEVVLTGEVLVVRGAVATDTRKEQVLVVVHEVLRSHECDRLVRDDTEVTAGQAPRTQPERL